MEKRPFASPSFDCSFEHEREERKERKRDRGRRKWPVCVAIR